MRVTALAGGTGAAKLLRGFIGIARDPARGDDAALNLRADELTVIGNTGDDAPVWGLHVSPDLDTVTYALAGLLDTERGWGRTDETFRCRDEMAHLGAETWFNLGDRDLAIHLFRTRALRAGRRLSDVTDELARRFGVTARILPMSDESVRTRVRTPETWLSFQEYFVRERARVKVVDVEFEGADRARPAPGVLDAIASADLLVVCPSNPITSIGPILAVPGILEALTSTRARTVAVSPVVGEAAVSGPAGELMRARGLPVSAAGVAKAYAPWLETLLLHSSDDDHAREVEAVGVDPIRADIIMSDRHAEVMLARRVLEAA